MKAVKAKKLVLDNSMLEEEFFEDALLIGIVSPLDSYKFIWTLNGLFNYSFIRNHDYEIEMNDVFFEVYSFEEPEKLIEHIIYTNRKKTNFLLEEAKNIDYVWMIKGGHLSNQNDVVFLDLLKDMKGVDHCFLINPQHIKSKQHLIL